MATIVTRAGKGSPLTNDEVDANFVNLNTAKAELSGAAFTGTISTTGSIGVGTSSPAVPLHVVGVARIGATGTDAQIQVFGPSTYGEYIRWGELGVANRGVLGYAGGSGALVYRGGASTLADGTEYFRIDASGNVGIGATAPNSKLEVYGGSVRATLAGASAATFRGYSMASDSTEFASLKAESSLGETRLTSGFSGFGGFSTFYTNGSERMRIDSAGSVGIGTTSPGTPLDVRGANGLGVRYLETTTGNTNRIQLGTGSGFGYIDATAGVGSTALAFQVASTERMRIDSSGNLGLGVTASAYNGAGKNLEIGQAGNILNGGTADLNLQFNSYYNTGWKYGVTGYASRYQQYNGQHIFYTAPSGTAGATIGFTQAMTLDAGGVLLVNRTGASGYGKLNVDGGADITGGNVLLCRDTGNVGVGTASPQRPLHVLYDSAVVGQYSMIVQGRAGGYGAGVSFQSVISGGGLGEMARITADGENSWNTTVSTQDAGLRFYTTLDGTLAEKMRLDSSGNVGIGTSTMFDKLNVYGTAASISVDTPTSTDNNGFVIRSVNTERGSLRMQGNIGLMTLTAGYAGYGGILAINTNGSERMRVDSSGNLMVGTTTSRGRITVEAASGNCRAVNVLTGSSIMDQFYFNGTATGNISTNGVTAAYNTSSDARLKHDIVDAPEASSLIDEIKVRSFKWNADNSEQRYGMIAQELLQVAPEAVHQPADPDQMMGVDYSKLVPMLIKEVQSLRARVAQLEGK